MYLRSNIDCMYELHNINQNIIKKAKAKKNWHSIILVSVQNTLNEMLSTVPKYGMSPMN